MPREFQEVKILILRDNGPVVHIYIYMLCGPGSSVGIATDYGLDGLGSNPGWDEIFRPSRPALGLVQCTMYNGYRVFPGGRGSRVMGLTPHTRLVSKVLEKSTAILLLTLWACVAYKNGENQPLYVVHLFV